MSQKEIVLVLHRTYFHDTFRDYPDFSMERYAQLKSCRFIARFIIEKKTDDLTSESAITSQSIYDDFLVKFRGSAKTSGAEKFLEILDKLICKVESPQINKLDFDEGILTIADTIYSTSSEYEPLLVVSNSAKTKFISQATVFYKATLGEKFTSIPFRILNYDETQAVLQDKYPPLCQIIKERVGEDSL